VRSWALLEAAQAIGAVCGVGLSRRVPSRRAMLVAAIAAFPIGLPMLLLRMNAPSIGLGTDVPSRVGVNRCDDGAVGDFVADADPGPCPQPRQRLRGPGLGGRSGFGRLGTTFPSQVAMNFAVPFT
jgi:hypothetical protein